MSREMLISARILWDVPRCAAFAWEMELGDFHMLGLIARWGHNALFVATTLLSIAVVILTK